MEWAIMKPQWLGWKTLLLHLVWSDRDIKGSDRDKKTRSTPTARAESEPEGVAKGDGFKDAKYQILKSTM